MTSQWKRVVQPENMMEVGDTLLLPYVHLAARRKKKKQRPVHFSLPEISIKIRPYTDGSRFFSSLLC